MKLGLARKRLTPIVGTPLAGYGARRGAPSTGVHDDLFAKALVLRASGKTLAFVSCDLVGISAELRRLVLERLDDCLGPNSHLLLCATHTHSGTGALAPGALSRLVLGAFDEKVLESTVQTIAEAIKAASKVLQPVAVEFFKHEVEGFNRNRRRPEGVSDKELCLLRFTDPEGTPLALVANFACHPTALGPENLLISRDWPGAFEDRLAELSGAQLVLFTEGGSGDQRPQLTASADPFERMEQFGRRLAEAAIEVLAAPSKPAEDDLRVVEQQVPITSERPALFERDHALVQVVKVGPVEIAALPAEVSSSLALAFKQGASEAGAQAAWLTSCANDYLGYVLSAEEYDRGGYEALMAPYGKDAGAKLITAALELVETVLA